MPRSFLKVLGHIAVLWIGVMLGYYAVLPYFGFSIGYNTQPTLVAAYYAWWILITVYAFRGVFLGHLPSARELRVDTALSALFALGASGFLWMFSHLEAPHLSAFEPATDLLLASPWYFLPKSIEILLQQVLIAVFVLELARQNFSLRIIVLVYAIVFGSAHLLLFFGGSFPPTVLIMTLAAVVSAAFFPYLMLRVPRGFLYAYMMHWIFYALLALLLRFSLPV
jgi:hypothetical protein